jgi:hypothetical protein
MAEAPLFATFLNADKRPFAAPLGPWMRLVATGMRELVCSADIPLREGFLCLESIDKGAPLVARTLVLLVTTDEEARLQLGKAETVRRAVRA